MSSYCARRAREYDDWWLGTGLFAERERPGWDAEVEELVRVLEDLPPARTLDVACGTAFLTRHLRGDLTALDQSGEMLEIAAPRLPHARLIQAEAVPLPFPDAAFERIFTSHFYGHLLAGERHRFLREAKRVADELIVVDSAEERPSTTARGSSPCATRGSATRSPRPGRSNGSQGRDGHTVAQPGGRAP